MPVARDPVEPEEAVSVIRSGETVMVGGFGLVGAPLTLIDALVETSDADDLTIVSNNIGEPGRGLGKLLRQGRIKRGISSYFTSNPEAVAAVNAGEIEALARHERVQLLVCGDAEVGDDSQPLLDRELELSPTANQLWQQIYQEVTGGV
jgi:3-oxoacid CoA-transferase subunit A/3-oxoadipate CoA-transferase alpha subunit